MNETRDELAVLMVQLITDFRVNCWPRIDGVALNCVGIYFKNFQRRPRTLHRR